MIYKATALMTADVLTKPQHGAQYDTHTAVLMGLAWFSIFGTLTRES